MTRYVNHQFVSQTADPTQYGFPDSLILNSAYQLKNFPSLAPDGYQGFAVDASGVTNETDTQYSFNSLLTKMSGSHNLRFGGEQALVFE